MSNNISQPGHSKRWYLFVLSAAIVLFDRWAKWAIVKHLPMYDRVVVIPGFLNITHSENPGAAFDILRYSTAPWKQPALIGLSLIAMFILVVILWKNSCTFRAASIGLALILGGAAGNFWDRVSSGSVVDFLDLFVGRYHWPVFNIADSSIVTGATVLVLAMLTPTSSRHPESMSR